MIASTQTNHPLTGDARPDSHTLSPVELATAKLKSAGLRITQPRLAILAAVSKRAHPTSIEQIHEDLGGSGSKCDLVTVYRCMAVFEEIGLVRRAFFHNGTALYEINLGQSTRYHVVCKATDQLEELDAESATELRRAIEIVENRLLSRGFTDLSHIVEFFAVSPRRTRVSTPPPPPAVPPRV